MSAHPAVSVVIPAYNAERFIGAAVESILAQTFGDFECIIVDDGSTDGTRSLLESLAKRDARIRLLQQENAGPTKALNAGLKVAVGAYIARQDADDLSLPSRFDLQKKFLDLHPGVALVGIGHSIVDEGGRALAAHHEAMSAAELRRVLPRRNCFCHGSVMMRREVLERVGGYREKILFAQDYDLFLRILETADACILGEAGYLWRKSSGAIGQNRKGEQAAFALLAKAFFRERRIFGRDSYSDLELRGKGDLEGIRNFLRGYRLRSRYMLWAARKLSAAPEQRGVARTLGVNVLWLDFFAALRKLRFASSVRAAQGWAR